MSGRPTENLAMERAAGKEQAVSLSSQFCSQVILQTILVSLEVHWKKWTMIAIIDTVSQWPYILKMTALEMGCHPSSLRGWYTPWGVCLRVWNIFVMTSQTDRCHSVFPLWSLTTNQLNLTELSLLMLLQHKTILYLMYWHYINLPDCTSKVL